MGVLAVKCPSTGRDFSTGIQTDWATFVRMENHRVFRSQCPYCNSEHSWRPEDAKIVDALPPPRGAY